MAKSDKQKPAKPKAAVKPARTKQPKLKAKTTGAKNKPLGAKNKPLGAKKLKRVSAIVAVEPVSPPPPPLALGPSAAVLDRLWDVVQHRRNADPNVSHSARLLSRGTAKVAQKFGEEAVECLIEATAGNRAGLIGESADVLYHLIVMWVNAGIRPDEVWAELRRREGISGIAEKASRAKALPLALGVGTTKIP